MARDQFKAVVLDLYDTLVKWDPSRLPAMEWGGRPIHSTIPWLVPALTRALDSRFDLPQFLDVYREVMDEIGREKERRGIEITCRERFARTLARLEPERGEALGALADELTRAHMAAIRRVTFAPAERVAAVRRIAPFYRLGLLSNFDDARTGREVLADSGVAELFEAVVISAEVGLRKPNPRIFVHLLELMRLGPHEVLFVGDSAADDVLGAQRAGIRVAWLSESKGPFPAHIASPDFVLNNLTELPALLEV